MRAVFSLRRTSSRIIFSNKTIARILYKNVGIVYSRDMESLKVVNVPEQATVQHAPELSESIRTAFAEARRVLLNLTRVERIDASFVHILYAAKRMAERDEKDFHLSGTVRPDVAQTLVTGGFCPEPTEDARELESRLSGFHANAPDGEDAHG